MFYCRNDDGGGKECCRVGRGNRPTIIPFYILLNISFKIISDNYDFTTIILIRNFIVNIIKNPRRVFNTTRSNQTNGNETDKHLKDGTKTLLGIETGINTNDFVNN